MPQTIAEKNKKNLAGAKIRAWRKRELGICKWDGCDTPAISARRSCEFHRNYMREKAVVRYTTRKTQSVCTAAACTQPLATKSMCAIHAVKHNEATAKKRQRYKEQVLTAYGCKCWGCGITDPLLLTLDHRYFDGAKERLTIPGSMTYLLAIREGFPERYRLLCWNCQYLARRGYIYEHEPGA